MTVSSIATGYDGISLLAGNAAYDPAGTWLIQRTAGTGSSTTISFTSIPTTYKHLQIRTLAFDGFASTIRVQFNSDTGANYATHLLRGNGTTVDAFGSASTTFISNASVCGAATNTYGGVGIIDIHDYASTTKNKTVRSFVGWDSNGAASPQGRVWLNSGVWLSTSAITSITLTNAGGSNFTTTSTFALYGMVG